MTGDWIADLKRVRPAYEQVAAMLRDAISSGRLTAGERLPTETELTEILKVSRSTVREALRVLAAQGLVDSVRGSAGGVFVALPRVEGIRDFIETGLGLLASLGTVSLRELTEVRQIVEVSAVREVAASPAHGLVHTLRQALYEPPGGASRQEQMELNRSFHVEVIRATGSVLLEMLAYPVFSAHRNRYTHSDLRWTPDVVNRIADDHRRIVDAIEISDVDAAADGMNEHIVWLSGVYATSDVVDPSSGTVQAGGTRAAFEEIADRVRHPAGLGGEPPNTP